MIQTVPALTEESIHIWTIPLAETKKHISEWLEVLSPDERYRAGRLRTPKDRARFVTSRGTLRSILGAYLEIETSAVEFSYGPWGKPCLASTETRLLHFNFSHSENFALCGLTRNSPIGVDIEKTREAEAGHHSQLARRFFSKMEYQAIEAAPAKEKTLFFFTCWTRKEAYLKRHGLGLHLPLSRFSVNADPRTPAKLLASPWCSEDISLTQLQDLAAPPGYLAATAIASPELTDVQSFQWN